MADALDAPLLTRLDDAAGYLTLNRPAKGNALDPALIEALGVAFSGCLADGARCIVFAGAGNNFCTGSDLSDLEALSDGDLLLRFVAIELLLQRVHAAPVVTIAIAHGRTLGAGADLFVACDRRIALTGSSFSFPGPGYRSRSRHRAPCATHRPRCSARAAGRREVH